MGKMIRLAVVGGMACGLVAVIPAVAQAVSWSGSGPYVFTNQFGNYTIYTQCSQNDHVGPGYISKWTTPTSTLLDEAAEKGQTFQGPSGPVTFDDASGGSATTLGLGKFVFRDFRQGNGTDTTPSPTYGPEYPTEGTHPSPSDPVYTTPPNSWPITGAMCASSNTYDPSLNNAYDPSEIVGGLGVTNSVVDQPPTYMLSNTAIQFGITVTFGDYYNTDILRVRYIWRFYDTQIKMWTRVAVDCSTSPCMSTDFNLNEILYIKGPKYVAGVNGQPSSTAGGFKRLVDFRSDSTVATTSSGSCVYQGSDPSTGTNKCPDNDRTRVRFDFGTAADGSGGGCSATTPCLNAIFRAYGNNDVGTTLNPDAASHPWEGSGYGLDQWAMVESQYPSPNFDNSACTGSGTNTSDQNARRWELVGYKNPDGGYRAAAGYYFAWLDCTVVSSGGVFYREMPPAGSSWGTYANFAFNSNWATSYS